MYRSQNKQRLFSYTALILTLLAWTIWRAPTNASKWRTGFNSAFEGLRIGIRWNVSCSRLVNFLLSIPIWRVGTQVRSINGDHEEEIFRLPSSPVNTTKIGDALHPAKCRTVTSCVVLCRARQLLGRKLFSTRLDCAGNEPQPVGRRTIISVRGAWSVCLPQCYNVCKTTEL